MTEEPKPARCSFCGKNDDQVEKLIAGPGVHVCDECIDLCQKIIEEGRAEAALPVEEQIAALRERVERLERAR